MRKYTVSLGDTSVLQMSRWTAVTWLIKTDITVRQEV